MITESGKVVAVDSGSLWIEVIQVSACQSCAARKGCGQSVLNRLHSATRNQVEVPCTDTSSYQIGDLVEIGLPERAMLVGSLMVYMLPLILMVAGMVVASGWGEPGMLLGGVSGLAFGLLLVRLHSSSGRSIKNYQPQLLGPVGDVDICESPEDQIISTG